MYYLIVIFYFDLQRFANTAFSAALSAIATAASAPADGSYWWETANVAVSGGSDENTKKAVLVGTADEDTKQIATVTEIQLKDTTNALTVTAAKATDLTKITGLAGNSIKVLKTGGFDGTNSNDPVTLSFESTTSTNAQLTMANGLVTKIENLTAGKMTVADTTTGVTWLKVGTSGDKALDLSVGFVYDAAAKSITLSNNTGAVVTSAGDARSVIPAATGTTPASIQFTATAANAYTILSKTAKSYFTLDTSGALEGFVFGEDGDKIQGEDCFGAGRISPGRRPAGIAAVHQ